jgi:hypothetical protein
VQREGNVQTTSAARRIVSARWVCDIGLQNLIIFLYNLGILGIYIFHQWIIQKKCVEKMSLSGFTFVRPTGPLTLILLKGSHIRRGPTKN